MAAKMFQEAENFNRQITARAGFDLALREGKNFEEAVQLAGEAVRKTHFEYARYNRAEFQRGKKSALFLFMQYLTSMMWMLGTSPAKWRILTMMLFAGGLWGGVPGAENVALRGAHVVY